MKKVTWFLMCLSLLFTVSAVAEEPAAKGISVEIGTFLNGSSTSGSPIDVSSSNNSAYGFKLLLPTWQYRGQNLRFTGGVDQQSNDISMGGVGLGSVSSTTFSVTLRDYFLPETCKVCPYGGVGFYQESRDQASLAGGALKKSSSDSVGVLAEGGVSAFLPFFGGDKLYADLNISKKIGQNNEADIVTTAGNALVTRMGQGNDLNVKASIGWKF